jgi:hypothetical protein
MFDLSTGQYLGVLDPAAGRLLSLVSEAQAVFEAPSGGLRLGQRDRTVLAADSGGEILAWALSPDRTRFATIEGTEGRNLDLVIRAIPSLKRAGSLRLPPEATLGGRPSLAFLEDGGVAYVDAPDHVSALSLDSMQIRRWPIPSGWISAQLGSSGRIMLVRPGDRSLDVFHVQSARALGRIDTVDGGIAYSAISASGEWLLAATSSTLLAYHAGRSGYELFDSLTALHSTPLPVVDGECAAITLDDGVLVSGVGAPLFGAGPGEALPELARAPGALFVPLAPESAGFGTRARYAAADDDRTELTIEALPEHLFSDAALERARSWPAAAIEYATRADPSSWLRAPERIHAACASPRGSRAVEFRMGLRPGETCSDYQRYVRVQEVSRTLLVAQINVPPGTDHERVRKLLEHGFDAMLGPLPCTRNRSRDADVLRPCP